MARVWLFSGAVGIAASSTGEVTGNSVGGVSGVVPSEEIACLLIPYMGKSKLPLIRVSVSTERVNFIVVNSR